MTFLDVAPPPGRHGWRERLADLAELHGWRCHMLGADWQPDMLLVRRPHLVWVFAEMDRTRLSEARYAALYELTACGQDVFVWRPSDQPKVERILR